MILIVDNSPEMGVITQPTMYEAGAMMITDLSDYSDYIEPLPTGGAAMLIILSGGGDD